MLVGRLAGFTQRIGIGFQIWTHRLPCRWRGVTSARRMVKTTTNHLLGHANDTNRESALPQSSQLASSTHPEVPAPPAAALLAARSSQLQHRHHYLLRRPVGCWPSRVGRHTPDSRGVPRRRAAEVHPRSRTWSSRPGRSSHSSGCSSCRHVRRSAHRARETGCFGHPPNIAGKRRHTSCADLRKPYPGRRKLYPSRQSASAARRSSHEYLGLRVRGASRSPTLA